MGITDMIRKAKEQHFINRDSNKLELQRANLAAEAKRISEEKRQVQEVSKLQNQIKKEKEDINSLRGQTTNNFLNKLKTNFQEAKGRTPTVTNNIKSFGSDQPNPFTSPTFGDNPSKLGRTINGTPSNNNPFSNNAFGTQPKPTMQERKPKTIIIKKY